MTNIRTSKTIRPGSNHDNQGKGAWTRKRLVSDQDYASNWERTFGKRKADRHVRKSRNGRASRAA